jgi:hypothetical protein
MIITSAIKRSFFDMYIVQELSASDIKDALGLCDATYAKLVRMAKEWAKATITTEFLEQIVVQKLLVNPNDRDALASARDIWKYKYKVPPSESDIVHEEFTDAPPPTSTQTPTEPPRV